MVKEATTLSKYGILYLAFLEGINVIAIEIGGGKIITSYFGNSYYAWASVLSVTMLGLAIGYLNGGFIARKKNTTDNLIRLIFLSSVVLACSVALSNTIFLLMKGLSPSFGVFMVSTTLLVPPLILLGSFGPILIQHLSFIQSNSGKSAGSVYFSSTLGGVTGAFLLGFLLLPKLGVCYSISILTFLSILSGIFLYYKKLNRKFLWFCLTFWLFFCFLYAS